MLLKNDGALPFRPGTRVALIGPAVRRHSRAARQLFLDAQRTADLGGRWPEAGDARRHGDAWCRSPRPSPTAIPSPESALLTPDGRPGIRTEYYNALDEGPLAPGAERRFAAKPVLTGVEPSLVSRASEFRQVANNHKVMFTGFLVVPETGLYRLALTGVKGTLSLGGKPLVEAKRYSRWAEPLQLVDARLKKGDRVAIRLQGESGIPPSPQIFWKRVTDNLDRDLRAGTADADVVVAVVGLTSDLEGEEMPIKIEGFSGGDKTTLDLPADQRALLERAKALGKPLVVVAMNGSAIDLSWAKDNAAAILEAWYPGQSGGLAVANVLTGKANPAGRLPLTFYKSVADLPPFTDYSMAGRTYRYFNGTPVYPFGHGLSYTTFSYGKLSIDPAAGGIENGLTARVDVTNTGARAGDEVAQAYITPPGFEGAPRLALRGFQRVSLNPGETKRVIIALSPRDLSFVTKEGDRQLIPGEYRLTIGSGQPATGIPGAYAPYNVRRKVALPR